MVKSKEKVSKSVAIPNSASKTHNPTVKKTFSLGTRPLSNLSVPPTKYAQFLNDCVNTFSELVLEHHKCESIEEAQEKYRKAVRKVNPNHTEEELFQYERPFIEICMRAELEFLKSGRTKKENFTRSVSETEHLFVWEKGEFSPYYEVPVKQGEIRKYVSQFRTALNDRYPERKNKMPSDFLNFKSKLPNNFRLSLELKSDSTDHLETNIKLRDWGSVHLPSDERYHVVGIQLKTRASWGSTSLPKKVTDRLEQVVTKYYKPDSVDYETSYSERSRNGK